MNSPARVVARSAFRHGRRVPRLLIIDDSIVVRSAIERIVCGGGDMEVVAKLPHVEAAIDYLRDNQVDVILLDHEMPGRRGLDALPEIMDLAQGARIAVLSGHCAAGSAMAVRALALGASDIITKPSIRDYDAGFAEVLVRRLLRLAAPAMVVGATEDDVALRPVPNGFRLRCIGIGASTGGIHALTKLFEGDHPKLGVPILVTQHLPAAFTPYFAEQLDRMTPLSVSVARHHEPLLADHIYIAPGEANLLCKRGVKGGPVADLSTARVSPLDPLPGVNPMFSAMAQCYGAGAAAIVLTGMGQDGSLGARQIVAADGIVLAQDRASSVIWGMPGHVSRAGLVSAMLSPSQMLGYLASLAGVSA